MTVPVCVLSCQAKPVQRNSHSFFFSSTVAFVFQRGGKWNRNGSFHQHLHFYKTLFCNRKLFSWKYVDDFACRVLRWLPKNKSHVEKQLTASACRGAHQPETKTKSVSDLKSVVSKPLQMLFSSRYELKRGQNDQSLQYHISVSPILPMRHIWTV